MEGGMGKWKMRGKGEPGQEGRRAGKRQKTHCTVNKSKLICTNAGLPQSAACSCAGIHPTDYVSSGRPAKREAHTLFK